MGFLLYTLGVVSTTKTTPWETKQAGPAQRPSTLGHITECSLPSTSFQETDKESTTLKSAKAQLLHSFNNWGTMKTSLD